MSPYNREGRAASKRTRGVVDRIEDGGTAVVLVGEDEGEQVELPASLLPEGTEGGDYLNITVSLDGDSRKVAEDRVKSLQEKLERRGDSGRKNFKL